MKIVRLVFVSCFMSLATIAWSQNLTSHTNEFSIKTGPGAWLPNTGSLPQISWVSPQFDFTTSISSKVFINASVVCFSPLTEIKLIVTNVKDGSTLAVKKFDVSKDLRNYDVATAVTVPDGASMFTIEVITEHGATVSSKRQVITGKDAEENGIALDRKDYVLMFATNKYDHWDDLVNPIDDAHAIADELKQRYGFIVELVENPTVEKIWEKLREYNEKKFAPQDQLMVFFAGHGHFDETFGEGYVVAKNSLTNDLSRTTYLSHNRLRGVINNIPCKHILLTMDVCFGGTLDPVIARSRGAKEYESSVNQMLVRKWSHQTRKYLTSGGKVYVSDGVVGKHSPFAGKLIESLRSRGGDDGVLTLSELMANLEKLAQTPRFGSFGDDETLSDFTFVAKSN